MKAIQPRDQLIDQMVSVWSVIAIAASALTLALASSPDNILNAFIPSGLAFLTLAVALARNKLSTEVKTITLAIISLAAGLLGIYTQGLYSAATCFIPLSVITMAMVFSARTVALFAAFALLSLAFLAMGFVLNYLQLPVTDKAPINSSSHWLMYLLGIATFLMISSGLIIHYRNQAQRLLEQLHAERDKLSQRAHFDELTGLPLARFCNKRLIRACHRAQRHDRLVALFFIDLDNFKAVNDRLGHDAGDTCLQITAQRMLDATDDNHIVSRISGDEFLLIMREVESMGQIERLAQTLIGTVSEPMRHEGHSFKVGMSIGIVIFPDHTEDPRRMRTLADQAMYDAKRNGKNTWAIYTPAAEPAKALETTDA